MTIHQARLRRFVVINLCVIVALLTCSGCASSPSERSAASAVSVTRNSVYDYEPAEGEMLIWFFSLEAEDRSGDAILVRFPTGETMLVDSGIEACGNQLKAHLAELGISRITYAVGTHPHSDHIGGFLALLGAIPVDNYITVNVPHDTETYRRVTNRVAQLDIPVTIVEAGDRFSLPGGVEILVMNPPSGTTGDDVLPGTDAAGINNLSLVFRMDYGGSSFVFTADIYREREAAMVETYAEGLNADVIKVPHHGESTSSSTAFVDAVSPEYAVITINILQSLPIYRRYQDAGAQVYLTGLDGTVLLICDESDISALPEIVRESDSLF